MRSRYFVIGMLWTAFALWLVVLCILSSVPGDRLPKVDMTYSDKVAHFGYFLVGGLILAAALQRSLALSSWKLAAVVALVLAVIGALDEWHQAHTPNRSGSDPADWLADCAGSAAAGGLVLAWIYVRTKDRKSLSACGLAAQRD